MISKSEKKEGSFFVVKYLKSPKTNYFILGDWKCNDLDANTLKYCLEALPWGLVLRSKGQLHASKEIFKDTVNDRRPANLSFNLRRLLKWSANITPRITLSNKGRKLLLRFNF
ncbi:MAG: hypothetical protein HWE07_04990 [Cytophagia bacterium]|nr:hypothetical protein [Cytophagia bacterium]